MSRGILGISLWSSFVFSCQVPDQTPNMPGSFLAPQALRSPGLQCPFFPVPPAMLAIKVTGIPMHHLSKAQGTHGSTLTSWQGSFLILHRKQRQTYLSTEDPGLSGVYSLLAQTYWASENMRAMGSAEGKATLVSLSLV